MTETVPEDPDPGRDAILDAAASAAPPKKKKRWLLRIALATPVALALLVLLIPTILSMGFVRRKIEVAAGEALARKVAIADHSIGWTSGVSVEGITVYEKDGTTAFLKIDHLRAQFPWKPLLDESFVLEHLTLKGVSVRVVKRRDGTLSTDDLGKQEAPAASPSPAPSAGSAPPEKGWAFTMGNIQINSMTLDWIDESAGKTTQARFPDFLVKPGATPDEVVANVSCRIEPRLQVGLLATLLVFDKGQVRSEPTGTILMDWRGLDAAALAGPMEGTDFRTGDIEGSASAKILGGGAFDVTMAAKVPGFHWGDSGQPATMTTPIDVTQELKVRGKVVEVVRAKYQFAGADVQMTGTVDLSPGPVDLVAKFDGEMSHFAQIFPSALDGHVQKGPLRSTWNIKGRDLDRLTIDGVAEVTSYRYTMTGDDGTATEYKVPHPGLLKVEAHGAMDLKRREERAKEMHAWAAMDGLTFTFEIRAPWIQSPDVDLKQVWGQFSMNEQDLTIERFDVVLNDGQISTSGSMDFRTEEPAWRMKIVGTDVRYSYEFAGLAALVNPALYSNQKGQVEAKMAFDLALAGAGFGMEEAKKTLSGEGTLKLEDGVLAGSAMLNELFKQLKLTETARYEFSIMEQKFRIEGGKVHNTFSKFQGEGKEADLTISGWTDFDANMSQKITVEGDPTARWGKTTGQVIDVFNKAGGLPLGGTVDAPKIEIDYEKALKGAVGEILKDPNVQDKAKELLDDIFGKKKKK